MLTKKTSCKNCQDRYVGCHSQCEDYNTFKQEKQDLNEKIRLHYLKSDNGFKHSIKQDLKHMRYVRR